MDCCEHCRLRRQFKAKKRYLVYAFGSPDRLTTGFCTRTKPIEYAQVEEKILFQDLLKELMRAALQSRIGLDNTRNKNYESITAVPVAARRPSSGTPLRLISPLATRLKTQISQSKVFLFSCLFTSVK
jgi:hypothetical protein